MRTMKPAVLFVFGILAALWVVGCSNPIATPGDAPAAGVGTGPDIDPDSPFTVTFTIGQSGNVRSVAGVNSNRIILPGPNGVRNYVQLIVVDQASGQVVEYDEERKINADDSEFGLGIDDLLRGNTYSFLLLMGHWSHDGSYNYYNSEPPTLLAAGLTKDKQLNPTGDTTVSITMYPLVVDTKFQSTDNLTTIEPVVTDGKPEAAKLPSDKTWKAIWTVQRSVPGSNGFEMALIPAQKVIDSSNAGNNLLVKAQRSIVSGTSESLDNTANSSIFSYTIPAANAKNGSSGTVNFNLEYVPFNLSTVASWTGQSSSYFPSTTWPPVWIIRNGVNDASQDGNTDFNYFGKIGYYNNNGNGAVRFVVNLPPGPVPPADNALTVENGKLVANLNTTWPTIQFDTTGYTGSADVWYAVVAPQGTAPLAQNYVWKDSIGPGTNHTERIAVPSDLVATGYDVYVFIAQGGKVSAPEIIRARLSGGVIINWGWGAELAAVTHTGVSGVTWPIIGSAPVTTFSNVSSQYTGGPVTWYDASNQEVTGTFASGPPYRAEVTLTAKPGYTFTGAGPFSYGSLVVTTTNNTGNTITVSITYPYAILPVIVDLTPYIEHPENGNYPSPLSTDIPRFETADYYCEGISWSSSDPSWSENDPFDVSNYEYMATVILNTKNGSGFFQGLMPYNFYCYGDATILINYQGYWKIVLNIAFPRIIP